MIFLPFTVDSFAKYNSEVMRHISGVVLPSRTLVWEECDADVKSSVISESNGDNIEAKVLGQ